MKVLLVVNARREEARRLAVVAAKELLAHDVQVAVAKDDLAGDAHDRSEPWTPDGLDAWHVVDADEHAADGCDLVIVLGGDGTILRGAERARHAGVPILGINLGHVGFLAEAESEDIADVVSAVIAHRWTVEDRLALDVRVLVSGSEVARTWSLNEVSVEKHGREKMIELVCEIDGRPLSRWGCDGVVAATPTGSTAYAFSAGGPVVWPQVQALLVVTLSAHALFSRPLVVSPASVVAFELLPWSQATLWADGRRTIDVPGGARVEIRTNDQPVRIARLVDAPFTDRLVAKFDLPVSGWRGRS